MMMMMMMAQNDNSMVSITSSSLSRFVQNFHVEDLSPHPHLHLFGRRSPIAMSSSASRMAS